MRPHDTSARLLAEAAHQARRLALGREELPPHAWLSDEAGRLTSLALPRIAGPEDHAALGAIIGVEMRARRAAHAMLLLPRSGRDGASATLYLVTGTGDLAGSRTLLAERGPDRRIAGLRADGPEGAPSPGRNRLGPALRRGPGAAPARLPEGTAGAGR